VLAGPTYQRLTVALPRSPLSLPHPTADTRPLTRLGPTSQSRLHRVGRAPPPVPDGRGHCWPPCAVDRHARGPPLLLLSLPCGRGHGGPSFFPSLPYATEALEKPPPAPSFLRSPLDCARAQAPPPSPPPTHPPHWLPPQDTPPPLRFPSERHRLRCFTVRPSHLPLLSPIEAVVTFPLPHRHCRAAPPLPPATGALSPPMNAAVPRLLHRLHATPSFG
jgi:hypothetical protein